MDRCLALSFVSTLAFIMFHLHTRTPRRSKRYTDGLQEYPLGWSEKCLVGGAPFLVSFVPVDTAVRSAQMFSREVSQAFYVRDILKVEILSAEPPPTGTGCRPTRTQRCYTDRVGVAVLRVAVPCRVS